MNNHEAEEVKRFWNEAFSNLNKEKISGKWIEDETFNNTINKYITENSCILDYGCGTGWCLFEIYYTVALKSGIGIDTSINAITNAKETLVISNINNLEFINGDESILDSYKEYFDAAISVNTIDVVPKASIGIMLKAIYNSLKPNGYFIVCINHSFNDDFLENRGFVVKDGLIYKDGYLRGNKWTNEEWIAVFKEYFDYIEYHEFTLTEYEKNFPRRMFILKRK